MARPKDGNTSARSGSGAAVPREKTPARHYLMRLASRLQHESCAMKCNAKQANLFTGYSPAAEKSLSRPPLTWAFTISLMGSEKVMLGLLLCAICATSCTETSTPHCGVSSALRLDFPQTHGVVNKLELAWSFQPVSGTF
jgi:hypothetical protein